MSLLSNKFDAKYDSIETKRRERVLPKGTAIPRRSNPTSRSDRFQSNPSRISSETDNFHKKPIGSDMVFVGFLSVGIRSGFRRNSTARDEIRL
jgi:hypothetical protein